MSLVMMSLLAMSTVEAAPTKGFRVQGCVGIDSTCTLAGLKVGYTHDYVGVYTGLTLGYLAGANVYLTSPKSNFRTYLKAGVSVGFAIIPSAGVGLDWHFSESRKWILSPQIGVGGFIPPQSDSVVETIPTASVDIIYAFGK